MAKIVIEMDQKVCTNGEVGRVPYSVRSAAVLFFRRHGPALPEWIAK